MNLPERKESPKAESQEKAWPSRQEFADRLKGTRQKNLVVQVPGHLSAIPRTGRIQPLFLGGDSGTGKGNAAYAIADALGWRLVETDSADLEKVLAVECALNRMSEPKVFFLDESAECEGSHDALLLKMLDTNPHSAPYGDGKDEKAWEYNQATNLFIMASNRGENNPALVGPEGRFTEIVMLPFSGEDLTWWLNQCILKFGREYQVNFSPDSLPLLTWLTSGIARNVENIVKGYASVYAGDTITPAMIRNAIHQVKDENGKPACAPAGRYVGMISALQYLADGQARRQIEIIAGSGHAQKRTTFLRKVHAPLLSEGFMVPCQHGFCITRKGIDLLVEIDSTLAEPEAIEPVKPIAKGKGGRK